MKPLSILALAIFVVITGCGKDDLKTEAPLQKDDLHANDLLLSRTTGLECADLIPPPPENCGCDEPGKTRTVKIDAEGTILFITPPPPGSPCEALGGVMMMEINGSGNMSHIGNFTVYHSGCMGPTGPLEPIHGFVTAANGDILYIVNIGASSEGSEGWQRYLVTGGTGRFEDACGYWDLCGTIEYPGPENGWVGTFIHEGLGEIRY